MAGTTTNYSLPYPESTDLVASYPALGQDLAEDLDTILAAKGDVAGETWTGTHDFTGATVSGVGGGLSLITTSSFSAVSTLSIDGCFDSTYDNYRMILEIHGGGTTAAVEICGRMRGSGTDNSASSYYSGNVYGYSTTAGAESSSPTTYFRFGPMKLDDHGCYAFDIFRPAIADYTMFTGTSAMYHTAGFVFRHVGGQLAVTTAYDGITIYPATSNMTGTVSIYGYEK